MRLRRIGLTRFKAFTQAEIEVAPLTVLIGHNNAGKSTVLHALAMLAQTVEQPGREQLATSGPRVDLGNDPLALAHGARHEGWGISLIWGVEAEGFPIDVELDVKTHRPIQYGQIFDVVRTVSIRVEPVTIRLTGLWPNVNPNEAFRIEATGPQIDISTKVAAGMNAPWTGYPMATFPFGRLDVDGVKNGNTEAIQRTAIQLATPLLMNALPQALRAFRYVGADRHVNTSAFEVLQGPVENPQNAKEIVNTLAYNREIRERVSAECRRVFNFGIDTQLIPGPHQTLVAVDKNGRALNAVNLGAGLVQFAWILAHLDMAVADALVYPTHNPIPFVGIEEPELHLHPAQQPDIAQILVNYVNANRQTISTTQSEHLLMALLQLVLEGQLKAEDLAVYYVDHGIAQRLEVDEKGRLSGGLKGFFEANRTELTKRLDQLITDD